MTKWLPISEVEARVRRFILDWNNKDLTDEQIISKYGIKDISGMEQIGAFLSADDVDSTRLKGG
jgi:hypothetical protein